MVRVNTQNFPMSNEDGEKFSLVEHVTEIKRAGDVRSWRVFVLGKNNRLVEGRICAVRKTEEAIKIAHEKIKKKAIMKKHITQPETMEYAKYVIVFTNYPEESFTDVEILEWYRGRWQVELTFKRFKSIAQLGHLPKYRDDSSEAWLYGKLFVALLTEKLIRHACSISPWGYELEEYARS